MSEPHDKDAKLLADTFHGDWSTGPAASFARAAAALARRRRTLQRTVAVASSAAALIVAVLLARHRTAPGLSPAQDVPPASVTRGYDVISDDELLAQVRDRPLLALMKPDGTREIVVLATEEKPASLE